MGKQLTIIFCLLIFCNASSISQQKQNLKNKIKHPKPGHVKSEIFYAIDADTTFNWKADSLYNARQDSIQQIQDSLNQELENKKIDDEHSKVYSEKWYPKDSLSYIDKLVFNLNDQKDTINLPTAIKIINENFQGPLQRARAIFFWIATTIKYDFEIFNNDQVQPILDSDLNAEETFRTKKGVCQNYANLYKYMCGKAGIDCEIIIGAGKNFPFAITPDESNHAWNCIKIGAKRMLIDVTWASIDSSRVDTYWFNTSPGEFIFSHFPNDSSWQLLKNKITRKQFNNYPIVSAFLFKSKWKFDIPEYGKFILSDNKFYISKPAKDKNYTIGFSITPYRGDNWKPYITNAQEQRLETVSVSDSQTNLINYTTLIPSKGIWWLKVNLIEKINNQYITEVVFPEVIILKLTWK